MNIIAERINILEVEIKKLLVTQPDYDPDYCKELGIYVYNVNDVFIFFNRNDAGFIKEELGAFKYARAISLLSEYEVIKTITNNNKDE